MVSSSFEFVTVGRQVTLPKNGCAGGFHSEVCDRCKTKQTALKQMSIRRLPLILSIHVKRFEQTDGKVGQQPSVSLLQIVHHIQNFVLLAYPNI